MKNTTIKLSLIETVVCRTPALSMNADLKQSWPALLELIRESSSEFFELVKEFQPDQLSQDNSKISFSLWKYFNRARFRATPFGSFGSVSWIPIDKSGPLTIEQKNQKNIFVNWPEKETLASAVISGTDSKTVFLSNSTWYGVGNEIRYLRYKNEIFELASIASQPALIALLNCCNKPMAKENICFYMQQQYSLSRKSICHLLDQLIEAQLLLNDRQPNITGTDYFQRIGVSTTKRYPAYIITERRHYSGGFDPALLRNVNDYLPFMNNFLRRPKENALDSFRKDFTRKFEQRAVPLAIALDPEVGVGYHNLASTTETNELLDQLRKSPDPKPTYNWTPQNRFLLNSIVKGGTVHLEDYKEEIEISSMPLPNTLSVLFHFSQGQMVIEQAGGCTANALTGRFTLAQPNAETAGKETAQIESDANPGILFFDVAYQAEKKVDNVNRRASLYPAELPILTWSCTKDPLMLTDILVAIRNGEIVLWSKKRMQRIVPRIASAYNYSRSDLALYRFLCDLQHQGLHSDLNFRWADYFPGLDYYPRVKFRNIIVSPASWKIPSNQQPNVIKWLQEQGVNFPFSCGRGDQLLYFDPAIPGDMAAFSRYCSQNASEELYLTENHRGTADGVRDEHKNSYMAQFIANYCHHAAIYNNYKMPESTTPVNYFPGDEWLYFEIYSHNYRQNHILTTYISPFLTASRLLLKKWFFIRYNDPTPHIRLRLQLKNLEDSGKIIKDFNKTLNSMLVAGFISDLQVKTYFPETGRYGAERIKVVEEFFWQDSKLVVSELKKKTSLVNPTLNLMEYLCKETLPERNDRVDFIRNIADTFSKEFDLDHNDYKKINSSYHQLEADVKVCVLSCAYLESFRKVMKNIPNRDEQHQLLADLIHMHVNRVFNRDQRLHEAVLYQYLLKRCVSQRGEHVSIR